VLHTLGSTDGGNKAVLKGQAMLHLRVIGKALQIMVRIVLKQRRARGPGGDASAKSEQCGVANKRVSMVIEPRNNGEYGEPRNNSEKERR
jgi:hypothetical protein